MEERIAPRLDDAAELEEAEGETDGWTVVTEEPAADPAARRTPVKEPVQ